MGSKSGSNPLMAYATMLPVMVVLKAAPAACADDRAGRKSATARTHKVPIRDQTSGLAGVAGISAIRLCWGQGKGTAHIVGEGCDIRAAPDQGQQVRAGLGLDDGVDLCFILLCHGTAVFAGGVAKYLSAEPVVVHGIAHRLGQRGHGDMSLRGDLSERQCAVQAAHLSDAQPEGMLDRLCRDAREITLELLGGRACRTPALLQEQRWG